MKLTYPTTLSDVIATAKTIDDRNPVVRSARRTSALTDLAYVAALAAVLCANSGLSLAVSAIVVLLVVALAASATAILSKRQVGSIIAALYENSKPGLPFGPTTLELEGNVLIQQTVALRLQVVASTLADPVQTPTHVFLVVHPSWTISIPRSEVPQSDLVGFLTALAQSKNAA